MGSPEMDSLLCYPTRVSSLLRPLNYHQHICLHMTQGNSARWAIGEQGCPAQLTEAANAVLRPAEWVPLFLFQYYYPIAVP
ncbi:Uncharacterized protein HZ326_30963 [Fusarium oxysporum f. sp. albedinis]|nr:Uncharacterized protein HZ326_30963 [Fusarium oxysporum f. sp. albedinis]